MTTLGKRLKASRKNKAMTQQELEKISGVSQQLISRIEGEKIESTTEVFNLADALEVNAKWLATGQGEMKLAEINYPPEDLRILEMLNSVTSKQKNDTQKIIEDFYRQNQQILEELTAKRQKVA